MRTASITGRRYLLQRPPAITLAEEGARAGFPTHLLHPSGASLIASAEWTSGEKPLDSDSGSEISPPLGKLEHGSSAGTGSGDPARGSTPAMFESKGLHSRDMLGRYDLWSLQGRNPDQWARPTQLHPSLGVSE
jgi:hypothetical protein